MQKVEHKIQSKIEWGCIDSYHRDQSLLTGLEKSKKRTKKADEKLNSKDEKIETMKRKMICVYKKIVKKIRRRGKMIMKVYFTFYSALN